MNPKFKTIEIRNFSYLTQQLLKASIIAKYFLNNKIYPEKTKLNFLMILELFASTKQVSNLKENSFRNYT